MANALKSFRDWLANQRNFIFSRYTSDRQEIQEPKKSLVELPSTIRQKLIAGVEGLPSNPADQQAILSTIDQAYTAWRENPNSADNSVVILSSPVAAVSRILSDTLESWAEQKQIPLRLLPIGARRTEITDISPKLSEFLHLEQESDDAKDPAGSEIVVIPNLSWCFLRSLDGLEGIEYIQSRLCNGSKNRFWIIGAGIVGWQYLNSVCNIEAYCGEVFSLPAIKPTDLQSWFEPIVADLALEFARPRIDKQILKGDVDHKTGYFNHLADVSQGVGTVAVQVFLKSIRGQKSDSEPQDETEQQNQAEKLIAVTPNLPSLPDLESGDRYILYSLLLHDDLTIAELAKSLGDLESEVQGRIQLLRRQGVVEQHERIIKINPVHYPRVKQELASNNFIIKR